MDSWNPGPLPVYHYTQLHVVLYILQPHSRENDVLYNVMYTYYNVVCVAYMHFLMYSIDFSD